MAEESFLKLDAALKENKTLIGPKFQFVVDNEKWTLSLAADTSRGVSKASSDAVDAVITLSNASFLDLVQGKATADELFRAGKLKIRGDIMKALLLKRVFATLSPSTGVSYLNTEEKETTSVRANHLFDTASLERYLSLHIPGFATPLSVKQFTVRCVPFNNTRES